MGIMPMIMASAVISTGRKRDEAGAERGGAGVADGFFKLLAGKADDKDGVGRCDAHAHDGAGERGNTDARVVRKRNQMIRRWPRARRR